MTTAVSAGVTIGLALNYYDKGGTDKAVGYKAVLDLTMAGVGLVWPVGFGISTIYFDLDSSGAFGDWGDPANIK